jgi:ribosomal protein L11 methylase PrmA
LEVLKLAEEYCKHGSTILDLGAQPFIISCALKKMGFNVTAFDIDPGHIERSLTLVASVLSVVILREMS